MAAISVVTRGSSSFETEKEKKKFLKGKQFLYPAKLLYISKNRIMLYPNSISIFLNLKKNVWVAKGCFLILFINITTILLHKASKSLRQV